MGNVLQLEEIVHLRKGRLKLLKRQQKQNKKQQQQQTDPHKNKQQKTNKKTTTATKQQQPEAEITTFCSRFHIYHIFLHIHNSFGCPM